MEISTEKLSKEMNDTLIHRNCVMRSGKYLADYLTKNNRSLDAIRLLARCSIHDISKIQNTEEFMSLASIVDEIGQMQNVEHKLSEQQIAAISLHWQHNSHHPEYYDSPNDMTDLDLLEMACDCHARSRQYHTKLLDFIDTQQELRFHFDSEHFRRLRTYCEILINLSKNDDYSSVLNDNTQVSFDIKDSTLEMLEHFDQSCYPQSFTTERLYFQKEDTPDFASIDYHIYRKEDNERVGLLSLKCNGFIEYKIYENYIGCYYASEAIKKLVEITNIRVLKMTVRKDCDTANEIALESGFSKVEMTENTYLYKLKKHFK